MTHEQRRFREKVSSATFVGYGTGHGWRQAVGLPGGGPSHVVTSLGVFGFDEYREMVLVSLYPGITKDEVQAHTGWPLRVTPTLTETMLPTHEELILIRRFDTL